MSSRKATDISWAVSFLAAFIKDSLELGDFYKISCRVQMMMASQQVSLSTVSQHGRPEVVYLSEVYLYFARERRKHVTFLQFYTVFSIIDTSL